MRITKLNNPSVLVEKLVPLLGAYGIELYDVNYKTKKSVNFRAIRKFNKGYAGGGVRQGLSIHNGRVANRQAKFLHYEEWSLVNDLINYVCDEYNLGGSYSSFIGGEKVKIRENGLTKWHGDKESYGDILNEKREVLGE